jgi:hypothetical protein
MAGMMGFRRRELFTTDAEASQTPEVDLAT